MNKVGSFPFPDYVNANSRYGIPAGFHLNNFAAKIYQDFYENYF